MFRHESHPRINRRLLSFPFRGFETKLKIVHNRHQPLKQRTVRVLDCLFFFASSALLVILEIGLAAELGLGTIPVFAHLRVALLSTGDELIESGRAHVAGGV